MRNGMCLCLAVLVLIIGCANKPVMEDGRAIAYASNVTGEFEIYVTSTSKNDSFQITSSPNSGGGYLAWSPNGKRLAFYKKYDGNMTWSIHTVDVDGSNWKRLTHEKKSWDSSPTWSPDGSIIAFSRTYRDAEGEIVSEIWTMKPDGSDERKIKNAFGGGPHFLTNNRLLYHSQYRRENSKISLIDVTGDNLVHLTDDTAEDWHPEVSQDRKKITFTSNRDGNFEIYIMNIDGTDQTRLTQNSYRDSMPSWSPEGDQIVFTSKRNGVTGLYIMGHDGTSERQIIENGTQPAWYKLVHR